MNYTGKVIESKRHKTSIRLVVLIQGIFFLNIDVKVPIQINKIKNLDVEYMLWYFLKIYLCDLKGQSGVRIMALGEQINFYFKV